MKQPASPAGTDTTTTIRETTHVTLVFLRRPGELLLAMKKRGFGAGKWNGAGGKLEPGETPQAAAIRECQEELGVTPRHLQKVCEIDFYLTAEPQFNHFAHVYLGEAWEGEPRETEEMRPRWFALDALPFDRMWSDDREWLPLVLAGKRLRCTYALDEHDAIVRSEIIEITPESKEFAA